MVQLSQRHLVMNMRRNPMSAAALTMGFLPYTFLHL